MGFLWRWEKRPAIGAYSIGTGERALTRNGKVSLLLCHACQTPWAVVCLRTTPRTCGGKYRLLSLLGLHGQTPWWEMASGHLAGGIVRG
ncbi:hypothetical protein LZ32DRAFT_279901 [Colletotrichum eremochloae]|nr:hypothetical protein LZ32DRAFT_279901 [Colletotrichum eremochloae]